MRQTVRMYVLIIFTLLIVFPPVARSEVKITLKNDREVIADSCKDFEGKLICEIGDGTFRIDKKDVLSTKKITIIRRRPVQEAAPDVSSADEKKEEPKDSDAGKAAETTPENAVAAGAGVEQDKRIADLNARKTAYEAEREALMKEREQLREEVKAAGVLSTNGQYQSFEKRLNDLDLRIKAFNEKVNKLNEEISAVASGPAEEAK